MLFLLGGFFLGSSLVGLTGPHEPNVTMYVGFAVVGLAVLIIGQQSAANDESSAQN